MGLIRLIILGLVIWMIWRWVKRFQANQQASTGAGKRLKKDNMVPCQYCSVHVPQQEAISCDNPDTQGNEPLWFCSSSHKEKYLTNK